MNSQKNKFLTIRNPLFPILISFILLILSSPFFNDAFYVEHEGLEGLSVLGDFLVLTVLYGVIYLIWIAYFIVLTVLKKKNNEKTWIIPMITVILIVVIPIIFSIISAIKSSLKENSEIFSNAKPEIVSYKKLSDIPIYDDYKVIGEEISENEIYNNIDAYKGMKVLVKGVPSYRGNSSTYFNKETVTIFNNDFEDSFIYKFTFVDTKSEFRNDNYMFFATKDTTLEDYYTYIYGTIKSIQEINSSGNDYKVINITPEKIYYTLYWDTMFIDEEEIVYSECAKEGNKCSDEEIKEGQVVNVSVNNKENLNFYVIKDDGEFLTLYGYEALEKTPYLSENDTKKLLKKYKEKRHIYDDSIDYYMYNYWGPYTLMTKLNELTKNWTNVPVIKNYSYNTTKEYTFKNITIKDGITNITSLNGNKTTINGISRARIIGEKELDKYDDIPEFYGRPCLRTVGTRNGSKCNIWVMYEGYAGNQFGSVISSYYNNDKYYDSLATENIHDENYIVPVIEIPKKMINDK